MTTKRQATASLTQREIEVLMVCASNYTFGGRRPNPRAQITAYNKLFRARLAAKFGPWELRRT